jgi:hypothetical protein
VDEVRRADDGELCGHVETRDGRWVARTVFGAELGTHASRDAARRQLLDEGLASLADRWLLRHRDSGDDEVVCIQEANAAEVTVARGYYALPGVPTLTISAPQIASGEWELRRCD